MSENVLKKNIVVAANCQNTIYLPPFQDYPFSTVNLLFMGFVFVCPKTRVVFMLTC